MVLMRMSSRGSFEYLAFGGTVWGKIRRCGLGGGGDSLRGAL